MRGALSWEVDAIPSKVGGRWTFILEGKSDGGVRRLSKKVNKEVEIVEGRRTFVGGKKKWKTTEDQGKLRYRVGELTPPPGIR